MITIGLGAQALLANEIEKLTSCAQFYTSKVIEAEDKEFGKILHDFTKTQPCGIKRNKAGKLAKITPANQRAKAQHWCGTAFHEPEWNPLYMQYLCYQQEIDKTNVNFGKKSESHTGDSLPILHDNKRKPAGANPWNSWKETLPDYGTTTEHGCHNKLQLTPKRTTGPPYRAPEENSASISPIKAKIKEKAR